MTLFHLGAPLKTSLPYQQLTPTLTQEGFATYGGPQFATIVGQVATNALHAAWFQKWFVHRRARPEEYAARVDRALRANATGYTIHPEILNSDALKVSKRLKGWCVCLELTGVLCAWVFCAAHV